MISGRSQTSWWPARHEGPMESGNPAISHIRTPLWATIESQRSHKIRFHLERAFVSAASWAFLHLSNLCLILSTSCPYSPCLLVRHLGHSPGQCWNRPLYTEGEERPNKEADFSRLVGGSFNKQRDCWDMPWPKTGRFPYLPIWNLRVYIKALMGFPHMYCPGGLTSTFASHMSSQWLLVREQWAGAQDKDKGSLWGASNCPGIYSSLVH